MVPLRAPRARVFSVCRSSKASDSLFWKVCARFRKCLDTYPALPGHPDRSIDADREAAFQRCTTGAEVVRRTPVFRATLPHPPTLGSDGEFKKLCPREGHRQPLTSLTATRCTRYSTRYGTTQGRHGARVDHLCCSKSPAVQSAPHLWCMLARERSYTSQLGLRSRALGWAKRALAA